MTRRSKTTTAEIRRVLRPAAEMGLKVRRYDVSPDGSVSVFTGDDTSDPADAAFEAWERRNAKNA